jgi:serine/threonine-protein kinase
VADRAHDGAFVGTWKYAAPEQIRGERATPATDLYAVGLVLYEMLCGIGPFEEHDSGSLVSQAHLKAVPPPVSKFAPWVPPSIVQLIAASLAKEPRQRPRDAYAFAERLFELEWANDGKDPNDRTAEGPLSRILSTAGGDKPSSKNLVAAAPARDRLGNVPLIGVPEDARRAGPTSPGMGGAPESTMPGEDALLAGLIERQDVRPRSKKERESGPSIDAPQARRGSPQARRGSAPELGRGAAVTMDAPPSAPRVASAAEVTSDSFSDGTTRKLAGAAGGGGGGGATAPSDTFASQESDARRTPRKTGVVAVPIALALLAVIAGVSVMAYRGRTPVASHALPPGEATSVPVPSANVATVATVEATSASTSAPPVVATASAMPVTTTTAPPKAGPAGSHRGKPIPAVSATPLGGIAGAVPTIPPAAASAPPPKPSAKDDSFVRGL